MAYTPIFKKPYYDGWKNLPTEETPITAEILNEYDEAIERIETQLEKTTELFSDDNGSMVTIGQADKTQSAPRSGVFGLNNDVSGANNVIGGSENVVTGESNVVSGESNTASGHYGLTIGKENENAGLYNALIGKYLQNMPGVEQSNAVIGYYNNPTEVIESGKNVLFAIGAGTESERKNVAMIDNAGNFKVGGKIVAEGGGVTKNDVFTSVSSMMSTLNSAINTAYTKGDILSAYDVSQSSAYGQATFFVVSVESESVSNSKDPLYGTRESKDGTAQYGYYKIAPIHTVDRPIICYSYSALVDLCNTNLGLQPGQMILTAPTMQRFYVFAKTSSTYTYTNDEAFLAMFSNGGTAAIGNYQLQMAVPFAHYGYAGVVKPNSSHFIQDFSTGALSLKVSTSSNIGGVMPDGESTSVDSDGKISVILTDSTTGTKYKLSLDNGTFEIVSTESETEKISFGSSDYENLENKPSINDVALQGNVSLETLGIISAINDIVAAEIGNIKQLRFEYAESFETLPTTGETGIFYLVPNTGALNNNYDEYIWRDDTSSYELVGTVQNSIDMTGYAKYTDITPLTDDEILSIFASVTV